MSASTYFCRTICTTDLLVWESTMLYHSTGGYFEYSTTCTLVYLTPFSELKRTATQPRESLELLSGSPTSTYVRKAIVSDRHLTVWKQYTNLYNVVTEFSHNICSSDNSKWKLFLLSMTVLFRCHDLLLYMTAPPNCFDVRPPILMLSCEKKKLPPIIADFKTIIFLNYCRMFHLQFRSAITKTARIHHNNQFYEID